MYNNVTVSQIKSFTYIFAVSVSKCSTSLLTNSSYILNPNFPNSFNNPGTCTYYIHKENDNGIVSPPSMGEPGKIFSEHINTDNLCVGIIS